MLSFEAIHSMWDGKKFVAGNINQFDSIKGFLYIVSLKKISAFIWFCNGSSILNTHTHKYFLSFHLLLFAQFNFVIWKLWRKNKNCLNGKQSAITQFESLIVLWSLKMIQFNISLIRSMLLLHIFCYGCKPHALIKFMFSVEVGKMFWILYWSQISHNKNMISRYSRCKKFIGKECHVFKKILIFRWIKNLNFFWTLNFIQYQNFIESFE